MAGYESSGGIIIVIETQYQNVAAVSIAKQAIGTDFFGFLKKICQKADRGVVRESAAESTGEMPGLVSRPAVVDEFIYGGCHRDFAL